jgi:hypothetical protein
MRLRSRSPYRASSTILSAFHGESNVIHLAHWGRPAPNQVAWPWWTISSLMPILRLLRHLAERECMANSFSRFATRIAYGAIQLPRIVWYVGHGLAMRRLSEAARGRSGESVRRRAHTDGPVPNGSRLVADMAALFQQDLANVEAGIPRDRYVRALRHRGKATFEALVLAQPRRCEWGS